MSSLCHLRFLFFEASSHTVNLPWVNQTIWRCPVWGTLVWLGETEASLPSHLISCNCAKVFSDYFLFTGSDWHSANPNPFLWLQDGGWASADVLSTTNRHLRCLTSLCCFWSSSSTSTVCKMKWDRKCVCEREQEREIRFLCVFHSVCPLLCGNYRISEQDKECVCAWLSVCVCVVSDR